MPKVKGECPECFNLIGRQNDSNNSLQSQYATCNTSNLEVDGQKDPTGCHMWQLRTGTKPVHWAVWRSQWKHPQCTFWLCWGVELVCRLTIQGLIFKHVQWITEILQHCHLTVNNYTSNGTPWNLDSTASRNWRNIWASNTVSFMLLADVCYTQLNKKHIKFSVVERFYENRDFKTFFFLYSFLQVVSALQFDQFKKRFSFFLITHSFLPLHLIANRHWGVC